MNDTRFRFVDKRDKDMSLFMRPSVSYWKDAWRRFTKHKMGMLGLLIVGSMLLFAIIAPFLTDKSYSDQSLIDAYKPPGREYLMGADNLGRDVFVKIAYGARISLSVGFVATIISLIIGVLYGATAGYYGGYVGETMMRVVDLLDSIPSMLYVILLMTILKPGLTNVYIVLGVTGWLEMARLVRGEVLSLRSREFVLAAKISGVKPFKIMLRYLIPNAMGPIIVSMTIGIPGAIFLESFLSFMGLGVSSPMASWGSMASEGIEAFRSHPNLLFFPAIFISTTILGFNFLGDGLRDALDPRMRR